VSVGVDGRKALAIAGANMRRTVKDRRVAFFALLMPLVIILLVGLLFGGSLRRLPVGVIDERGDSPLRQQLAKSPALKLKTYHSLSTVRRDVRRGRIMAGIVIPTSSAGDTAEPVTLVSQPGRQETVTVRAALASATAALGAPSAGIAPVVRHSVHGKIGRKDPSPYSYTSAGNLLLFTFVNSLALSAALVNTRQLGITRRMLATPTSSATVVFGELLGRLGVAAGQAIALLAFGAFVFDVHWGDPRGVIPVVALYVLVSTGAGLLVGTLAKSEEQAISIAIPVGVGLAMLGGCMWPLSIVGPLMRAVGHLTPQAWAMDSFLHLVLAGDTAGSVVPAIVVLAGFAIGLMTVATWRMRQVVVR